MLDAVRNWLRKISWPVMVTEVPSEKSGTPTKPGSGENATEIPEFWEMVRIGDVHLDEHVSDEYKEQPLAQDWARVCKVIEELGECIAELILFTGQNPRKKHLRTIQPIHVLEEFADVACTCLFGIQHFTKDTAYTEAIVTARMKRIYLRLKEWEETIH